MWRSTENLLSKQFARTFGAHMLFLINCFVQVSHGCSEEQQLCSEIEDCSKVWTKFFAHRKLRVDLNISGKPATEPFCYVASLSGGSSVPKGEHAEGEAFEAMAQAPRSRKSLFQACGGGGVDAVTVPYIITQIWSLSQHVIIRIHHIITIYYNITLYHYRNLYGGASCTGGKKHTNTKDLPKA